MHTSISKNHKMKRATLLIKRMRCIRNLPGNKKKSYKPLYEKLKINNHSLAKALSKEKQDNKALFSQNVALIAENQDLEVACNKRDNIISNVMRNAKEILKMLVQTTGYVTNTITLCQEFTSANKENVQTPCNILERQDSSMKRLSGKSPARGVVKPMVSGHTITKPTINLSRVNIHRLSDRINLSTIAETSTRSDRSQNADGDSSPIAAPISRQVRYENGRACRLPERLPISSPRTSEEDERRLSRKSNRHSGKVSGKHSRSKSNRLSDSGVSEHPVRRKDSLGSPCVKLNDVSKFLQNSQRVNVQTLHEQRNSTVHDNPLQIDTIRDASATTRVSDPEMTFDCTLGNYSKLESSPIKKGSTTPECYSTSPNNTKKNKKSNKRRENNSTGDDPLEGPSWLYNDLQSESPSKEAKESLVNDTHLLLKSVDHTLNGSVNLEQNETSNSQILKTPVRAFNNMDRDGNLNIQTPFNSEANEFQHSDLAVKLSFITQRRGCLEVASDDDTDDFTLMYKPPPSRNQAFGLEDLRLPTLERPVMTASHNFNREHEPEITETIKRITQNFLPSAVSNNSLVENGLDSSTMKLPLYLSTMEQAGKESTPSKRKTDKHQPTKSEENSPDANTSPQVIKKKNKRKKKSIDDKDPSTAKVVLQKLNDTHVKKKSVHSKESQKKNSQTQSWNKSPTSAVSVDSTDSDTSTASNKQTSNRPRRRKAPMNLQEPSLTKKLRREH